MRSRERLKRFEIAVLKYLHRAGALHAGAAISLKDRFREFAVSLWRRGLVEIWHHQIPGEGSRGPLYALSQSGQRLIQSMFAANEELPRKLL